MRKAYTHLVTTVECCHRAEREDLSEGGRRNFPELTAALRMAGAGNDVEHEPR